VSMETAGVIARRSLECPAVFNPDLILLIFTKVIDDVECLANLLWRLSSDHVSDCFASEIKQGLNVEIIGSLHRHRQMK